MFIPDGARWLAIVDQNRDNIARLDPVGKLALKENCIEDSKVQLSGFGGWNTLGDPKSID